MEIAVGEVETEAEVAETGEEAGNGEEVAETEVVVEDMTVVVDLTAVEAEVAEEVSHRENKEGKSNHLVIFSIALANPLPSVFNPGTPPIIDARLQDTSQDELIQSFRSLAIRQGELPNRPDFGVAGTKVTLRSNFFPVKVPKGPLCEYDVDISPKAGTAIRRVKRRIWQLAEQTSDWQQAGMGGIVAHDHAAKLIAARRLPQPLVIQVPFYDEDQDGPKKDGTGKVYTLTIKFIQDLETQSLIRSVNSYQARFLTDVI